MVPLRPTTILTTRKRSKQADAGDKRAYLTEAEVEQLIKAAETPRDKAMILIGYRHGLRVSELVNLRWRRIDLDAGRIQVERLKDSESGVHPLSGREIRALRALRRPQPVGSAFVFLSYKGAPMTRQAFDWRGWRCSLRVLRDYTEAVAPLGRPYIGIRRAQREEQMRQSVLVGISLLALAACAPQPSPLALWPEPLRPAVYAAGSPSDTTSAFDGTYASPGPQTISKPDGREVARGNAPIYCPDLGPLPPVTIHNGLAQFQTLDYTFQGYVTRQGRLKMDSVFGQTIDGEIDNEGVFRAQGLGGCAYAATWRRSD